MLPIGYLSREVQRKPILDLELFVEKLIEPKIDLKARTGRIWTFSRTKLVSECQLSVMILYIKSYHASLDSILVF